MSTTPRIESAMPSSVRPITIVSSEVTAASAYACLAGGGAMGGLMRSMDWSMSSIGPVESWSPMLRMTVRLLLANGQQMFLWWGPQFCQIYNDAAWPALGTKHPQSMGQAASECWTEIWHLIGPLIETPFNGGEATWMEDIYLELNRKGFMEETHWTIAYSPVPDDDAPGGIGGVIGTVNEITEKVVGERRVRLLRDLGARSAEAKSAEEACAVAAKSLDQHREDVPFGLLYLIDGGARTACLAAAAGISPKLGDRWREFDLRAAVSGEHPWPLAEAIRSESLQLVEHLQGKLSSAPAGPWSDPPRTAVVCPIPSNIAHQFAGLLVLGVSSRLEFDERYRGFCELLTSQVATMIANARAHEGTDVEGCRQAPESLAEARLELARMTRVTTMGELAASIAHEVKQPLAAIAAQGNACTRWLAATPPNFEEANRGIERIVRNAGRAAEIVTRIRGFLRRDPTTMANVNINDVIADVVATVQWQFRTNGVSLVLPQPDRLSPVSADRVKLQQVILNLVMNAIDAMRPVTNRARVLEIGTAQQSVDWLRVSVRDSGVGLDPHGWNHIFDAFHTTKPDGMGMGLAISRSIVEAHGGRLWATPNEDWGAAFHLTLPAAPNA
jgi:signal transduction histidine kinase